MKERLLDVWKDIRMPVTVLAVVISFGFSLPYINAPAYGVDKERPDGSIVVNAEDTLVPGDWGLIDDLAFSLYSNRLSNVRGDLPGREFEKQVLNESYKRAYIFLTNMEKVRKPYIEQQAK